MKLAVTSASSVRGYNAISCRTRPAEMSAPTTMQALAIDPLLRITNREVVSKMFPLYWKKINQSVQLKRHRSAE